MMKIRGKINGVKINGKSVGQTRLIGLEDRYAIAEVLREELRRQFGKSTGSRQVVSRGDVARLRIAGSRIEHKAKPAAVGAQAAQGIAREIKP